MIPLAAARRAPATDSVLTLAVVSCLTTATLIVVMTLVGSI